MDIAAWLRNLGLEQYEQAFRENAVDPAVLPKLTAEDLKDLGVSLVGHGASCWRQFQPYVAMLVRKPTPRCRRLRPSAGSFRLCSAISSARRRFPHGSTPKT